MLPQVLQPYARLMRLHQPIGIWLLFWPCAWSLALASDGWPLVTLLALFALGALLMRSAGCIVNDLWDRTIDAQVERTRTRPLASGELSPRQAMILLASLLCAALTVAMALGWPAVVWSAAALPLVAVYPFMKRITGWPQLFLGLTFNWGALLGAVAACGHLTPEAGWLYLGGIFWTLGYDTIYAHQDKTDDARIGIRSTALTLGNHTRAWLAVFYGAAVLCFGLAGMGSPLHLVVLGPVTGHFAYQITSVRLHDPASCSRVFRSNAVAGGLIFLAFLAGKLA